MFETLLWGGEILEDWKIKIAVLWLVFECAAIVTPMLGLYEAGYIEDIIAQEVEGMPITPELILLLAVIMMIAPIMAFLSLTLKDSTNRWANIIVGLVFAAIGILGPIEYLAKQSAYSAYMTLIGIVELAVAALIVWYAWKSKQKA